MAASEESHWRKLGDLLVAENVLVQADLDFALAVQRQTGGLLGEILVTRGFVSNAQMVQALARQHGMRVNMAAEMRERRLRVPRAPTRVGPIPWKPLGRLLVDLGLLTEDGLKRALIDQRRTGRLLGEILVNRGWVAAEDVARAVAQQHGLEVEGVVEAEIAPPGPEDESFEIRCDQGEVLHVSPTFLDATDLAFDVIEREDPGALEIVRLGASGRERVWSYSRADAQQEAEKQTDVGPFGYPVTAWRAGRQFERRSGNAA